MNRFSPPGPKNSFDYQYGQGGFFCQGKRDAIDFSAFFDTIKKCKNIKKGG